MAKKRFTKKSGSNFKIPESFSGLTFQNKIISVVLVTLVIGIIASLFPGQGMTGAFSLFGQDITFTNVDKVVKTVFPAVPTTGLIYYEKLVLFLLLFALLSGAAKLLNLRGMTNVVVAGAISLISVWFIPAEVLKTIGLTYSSVYASLLMLIPIFTVGYLAWKIPGTKGGCFAKAIIYLVLLTVFGSTKEGLKGLYLPEGAKTASEFFTSFTDTIILVLIVLTIWYVIKAVTISAAAEQEAKRKWLAEKSERSIANIILTKVEEGIAGGAERGGRMAAGGRP